MKLNEQMRAQHVKRWGIVQVAREQTIAEHMYGVAVIAGHLATRLGWEGLKNPERQLTLLRWALSHDLIEVLTGDLASPFKSQAKMLNDVFVEQVEGSMSPWYAAMRARVADPEVEMIVKLADMIEALNFITDNGLGQHAVRQVESDIRTRLTDMIREYSKTFPQFRIQAAVDATFGELGLYFSMKKGQW
jgi:5'-deoxynucleotidase